MLSEELTLRFSRDLPHQFPLWEEVAMIRTMKPTYLYRNKMKDLFYRITALERRKNFWHNLSRYDRIHYRRHWLFLKDVHSWCECNYLEKVELLKNI